MGVGASHRPFATVCRVTSRVFRIKVRGEFKNLTPEQRAFTFRFSDSGESDEDIVPATERAEAAAEAWLNERNLAFRLLTSQAEDLSKAPMSKRQRRSQREG